MNADTAILSKPPESLALAGLHADHELGTEDSRVPLSRPRLYAHLARRYLDLVRTNLTQAPHKRDASFVSAEYEAGWMPGNQEFAATEDANRAFFLVRGKPVHVNGWFIIRRYADVILQALTRLDVRSVLEVGAGRGKNLGLFALRRPDLELSGLELTTTGVENSRRLAAEVPPQMLRAAGIAQLTDELRASLGRIQFHQGNAMAMPFADKSFDASFTSLVLEQLPRDYPRVLEQMRRVTRRFCIFNEAFLEANGWWGGTNLARLDYFRASAKEFANFGLEPVFFTTALPQKVTFRTGLLVCRVVG